MCTKKNDNSCHICIYRVSKVRRKKFFFVKYDEHFPTNTPTDQQRVSDTKKNDIFCHIYIYGLRKLSSAEFFPKKRNPDLHRQGLKKQTIINKHINYRFYTLLSGGYLQALYIGFRSNTYHPNIYIRVYIQM